jgi:hypothetical protein
MNDTIYFVSGHQDITAEEFEQHYVPRLTKAVNEGASFVVGDARGCDARTQAFLFLFLANSPNRHVRVTVYHMHTTPRVFLCSRFDRAGGFTSDTARDSGMTVVSDEDIAWVRPGREKSGTAKNLERRVQGLSRNVPAWQHIGEDLEARYDGRKYVDVRPVRHSDPLHLTVQKSFVGSPSFFLSKDAFENALKLFPQEQVNEPDMPREGSTLTLSWHFEPVREPISVEIHPNGDIFVNGRIATTDQVIAEGLHHFVEALLTYIQRATSVREALVQPVHVAGDGNTDGTI